jgi:cysteine sulfinate desulfinase/cysteine desulfurase-like protein
LKGVARFYKSKKKHIVTTQTEHKCVLDSCRVLQEEGFDVTYLPVGTDGLISLDDLKAAIREGNNAYLWLLSKNCTISFRLWLLSKHCTISFRLWLSSE